MQFCIFVMFPIVPSLPSASLEKPNTLSIKYPFKYLNATITVL